MAEVTNSGLARRIDDRYEDFLDALYMLPRYGYAKDEQEVLNVLKSMGYDDIAEAFENYIEDNE